MVAIIQEGNGRKNTDSEVSSKFASAANGERRQESNNQISSNNWFTHVLIAIKEILLDIGFIKEMRTI